MKQMLVAVLLLLCVSASAQKKEAIKPIKDSTIQQEKKFSLLLNEAEVNALLFVVDQSNAPHSTVNQVQKIIIDQLKLQVEAYNRQAADSTKKELPKK